MGIVKSMLGGLVGGAIGAVVASVIQSAAGVSSPWFLLVTGLGTGIGVRAAAGANRNFATGVVGAVTTVVVLLGSSVATSLAQVSASPEAVEITEIEAVADPSLDQESDSAGADDAAGEAEEGEDAESAGTESEDASESEEDPDSVETLDEEAARAATAAASAASSGITADGPITDEAAVKELERQTGWSVMDFLFNGVSALLAFALSSGSGSNASRSEPNSESQS